MQVRDHPRFHQLNNELHARPFPKLDAPSAIAYLGLTRDPRRAADTRADRAELIALLDRFGAAHPPDNADHWTGDLGRNVLKWECHSEIVTFTLIAKGDAERGFDAAAFDGFPADWLASLRGERVVSAQLLVLPQPSDDVIARSNSAWFASESVAVARVMEDDMVLASDLRIDAGGHLGLVLFARDGVPSRRIGRAAQRVLDLVTYINLSLLGFEVAKAIRSRLSAHEAELSDLVTAMDAAPPKAETTLDALLHLAAALERTRALHGYRFGATRAYAAIVRERIALLDEHRLGSSQLFREFLTRRFEPAVRTVEATENRLSQLAERARRAGDLLRTRVDVQRTAQNQQLLESLDARAATQLHLQRTVEGLSVVAISYYALSLGVYLLTPLAHGAGIDKAVLGALLVPPVVLAVWLVVRRIRKSVRG